MAEQADSRNDILRAVLRSVGAPQTLALPLLARGVWGAARHGTAPPLAELNGLFKRLQALLKGERRFAADAAHGLRPPLAALRMQAQVALGSLAVRVSWPQAAPVR